MLCREGVWCHTLLYTPLYFIFLLAKLDSLLPHHITLCQTDVCHSVVLTFVTLVLMFVTLVVDNLPLSLHQFGVVGGSRLKADDFLQNYQLVLMIQHRYCLIPHTRIHTCIHTRIHTCIHTRIHTCIHTRIHTCIHTRIHTCIHTCIP